MLCAAPPFSGLQLGFVRLVSNPAFSRDAVSPVEALALLAENVKHVRHEFWIANLQVSDAVKDIGRQLEAAPDVAPTR